MKLLSKTLSHHSNQHFTEYKLSGVRRETKCHTALHLEFTTVAGSIEYQKLGYVSGGWVITLASYANVGSSLRLGENGTLQQYPVSQLTFSNPPSNPNSGGYIQSDIYDYD